MPLASLGDLYPQRRLTEEQTKSLHLFAHILAVVISIPFDTTKYTIALMILGRAYNEYDGSSNCAARNLINAITVVFFCIGSKDGRIL